MSTVINNPGGTSGDSSGVGIIVGVILAILVIFLFFRFGLPAMRNDTPQNGSIDVNLKLPAGNNEAPAN
ncbi:MAG: hypothetical protein WCT44_02060 [Candidatus Paceibacterota bacterium]